MDRQIVADLEASASLCSPCQHREQWGHLYAQYASMVRRYLARNLLCPHDVDDLTQGLFAKLIICRRLPENPRQYIYAAARNELRSYWRKKRQMDSRRDLSIVDVGDLQGKTVEDLDPSEQLQNAEEQTMIQQAMRNLPAVLMSVLQLRIIEGMSLSEMAQRTGCSRDAVKKRLQRAKRHLLQYHLSIRIP